MKNAAEMAKHPLVLIVHDTSEMDFTSHTALQGTGPIGDGKRELKCAPEVEAKFYETARDFDGLGRILRCTAPLLVMFGARGDSLGASLSGKVAEQLKIGRVIDVADTGHFLPMEEPEYVAEQAIEFLTVK